MHASRTPRLRSGSGGRVSNTYVTCPEVGDNPAKAGLIPHVVIVSDHDDESLRALSEGRAAD